MGIATAKAGNYPVTSREEGATMFVQSQCVLRERKGREREFCGNPEWQVVHRISTPRKREAFFSDHFAIQSRHSDRLNRDQAGMSWWLQGLYTIVGSLQGDLVSRYLSFKPLVGTRTPNRIRNESNHYTTPGRYYEEDTSTKLIDDTYHIGISKQRF